MTSEFSERNQRLKSRSFPFKSGPDAPLCASDKARLLIALVIAKHTPLDRSPLEYVLKLQTSFPIRTVGGALPSNEDRWLGRIEELEQKLELARAREARAQLELVTYQAQHPPVSSSAPDSDSPESSNKRPAPDSPPSGSKKAPKKRRKQPDANSGSKLTSEDLGQAVQSIQSAFDHGTHIQSIGLISSLLRLRTQTQIAQINESRPIDSLDIQPLIQRCLADIASHVRHVCAYPTSQSSLDGLNALRVVLPQLLVAATHLCDSTDLTHTLITLALSIIHAFHPATVALLSPAARATASARTKRGKVKTGARAARESEEASGSYLHSDETRLVDVRPGLLSIFAMVARALSGGAAHALLPVACRTIRDLVTQQAPVQPRAARLEAFAVSDSVWYLCSACHTLLEGARITDKDDDIELIRGCAGMFIEALQPDRGRGAVGVCADGARGTAMSTRINLGIESRGTAQAPRTASRAHMNDAVDDMLCAVLERIMVGFPGP